MNKYKMQKQNDLLPQTTHACKAAGIPYLQFNASRPHNEITYI